MKSDLLYIIGLILALLTEILPPLMPIHTPELADAFFLIYFAINRKYSKAYVRWMVAVTAFFTLSMLWSIQLWECYWGLRMMITVFIGALATSCYLKCNPNGITTILKIYLVLSLVLLLFILGNINQLGTGMRLGTQLNYAVFGTEQNRMFNSNLIAMDLCYAVYVGYILLFQRKSNTLIKLLAIVAGVFVVYVIMLTGSRKGLLMLLIPLIVFPFLQQKKSKALLTLAIVGGMLVVGAELIMNIPVLYDVLGKRVEDAINIVSNKTGGGEDESRWFLILYGMEWFKEKPILGYGINNFRVLSNGTSLFMGNNFYAHNNYVELLVDVGIIGFFIYYSCYIIFWKKLKGRFSDNKINKWIFVIIIVLLFLDTAVVSYYSFISNFILCLCFHAVDISRGSTIKSVKIKK